MCGGFHCLLLLFPFDDVSDSKDVVETFNLESGLDLDFSFRVQCGGERRALEDVCVWSRSAGGKLRRVGQGWSKIDKVWTLVPRGLS